MVAMQAKNEPKDNQKNEKQDQKGEPDGTNEDDLLFIVILVKEGDVADGAENAELGRAFPGQTAGTGGGGENDGGGGTDELIVGVDSVGGENFAISKEITDGELVSGTKINVAVVFDGDGGSEGRAEEELGQFLGNEYAADMAFACDVSVN